MKENPESPLNRLAEGQSFGDHLEALRRTLLRVLAATVGAAVLVFCFKVQAFAFLLAPSEPDFVTYRYIERLVAAAGMDFRFGYTPIRFIATELSSQFMMHLSVSLYLGLLLVSPYVLVELFHFVAPALYARERRVTVRLLCVGYLLFAAGLLLSYYVLFPVSFRFLGTYSVDDRITTVLSLSSYVAAFTSLTLVMGLVFQLPVLFFLLGRMGVLQRNLLRRYRRHAFILIMVVAAFITPPDVLTLILVTLPLYALFEVSLWVLPKD